MKSSLILDRNQVDSLLLSLSETGLAVLPNLVPQELLQEWNIFFDQKVQLDQFKNSHIGPQDQKSLNLQIRSDSIYWLQGNETQFNSFWQLTQQLKELFNNEYYLSLKSYEFHLARYQPGNHYEKHKDRHQNSGHRHISMICYLNSQWSSSWGGELDIYKPDQEETLMESILPSPGQVVLFRSELFPHAVRKSSHERRSLTGWFRDDEPSLLR